MNVVAHSPLQVLSHNLDDMITSVTSVDSDLKSLQDLLKDLNATLGYPAKIEGDLKKVQAPLTTIQKLANDISVLPEIGQASKGVATVLKPFVAPKPPGGLIGEARAILKEMDTALSGLKTGLGKIKKPVDKAQGAFDKVLTKLGQFKAGVDYLIRIHGNHPPKGVKTCARTLNKIIETAKGDLEKAIKCIGDKLEVFHNVGAAIDGVLRGIGCFVDAIHQLTTDITTGAFKSLQNALKKIEKKLDELRHLAEWLFRQVMKGMGIDIDKLENGLKRLEARIDHFIMKTINDALEKAVKSLKDELDKIPAVKEFERILEEFQDKIEKIRDKVENGLGVECTKVLTAVA